jgi:hypothetical protein
MMRPAPAQWGWICTSCANGFLTLNDITNESGHSLQSPWGPVMAKSWYNSPLLLPESLIRQLRYRYLRYMRIERFSANPHNANSPLVAQANAMKIRSRLVPK